MIQILKPIVSLLMFLIVLFFVHTMLTITTSFPIWPSIAISFLCAVFAAWFSWNLAGGRKTGIFAAVFGGALIFGALFFVVGFLAPMVLAKDTSQWPMVGIFIAAPLGVILGAIGGYVYVSR